MGTLILFVVFGVVCVLAAFYGSKHRIVNESHPVVIIAAFSALFTVVFFAVFVVGHFCRYYNHVCDQESLIQLTESMKISQTRANDMVEQFKVHLAQQYPDLERDIFTKIAPDNVSVYLANYPQLKSSETLTKLVDEIKEMWNGYYAAQFDITKVKMEIRVRQRSPWFFSSWLPDAPPEVQTLLVKADPTPPSK
jgi:hypothetical protein